MLPSGPITWATTQLSVDFCSRANGKVWHFPVLAQCMGLQNYEQLWLSHINSTRRSAIEVANIMWIWCPALEKGADITINLMSYPFKLQTSLQISHWNTNKLHVPPAPGNRLSQNHSTSLISWLALLNSTSNNVPSARTPPDQGPSWVGASLWPKLCLLPLQAQISLPWMLVLWLVSGTSDPLAMNPG
jgi:hypothetical protein